MCISTWVERRKALRTEPWVYPRKAKGVADFLILTRLQVLVIRSSWFWVLILGTAFPLALLFFLLFFTASVSAQIRFYILTGNLVYALAINGMLAIGQELGWQRENRSFEFYATLPISKHALLLALLTRSVLFSLPSVMIILIAARFLFGLVIPFHPLLLILLVLASYSLVGFGALIGLYSPSNRVANNATQFLALIIAYLSPLMVPKENLPQLLQWTSAVLPTTYVAEALRLIVSQGQWSAQLQMDFAILGGFVLLSFLLIQFRFDWRVE